MFLRLSKMFSLKIALLLLTDASGCSAAHCGIVSPAMHRTTDHNANGVINAAGRKFSASRKFHASRKIEPTDIPRMANRNLNGTAKHHDMLNGQAKKVSTTSLDPNSFFEAATLLGSVGSLKAAETTERVRRGSTSHEEDIYKGFSFPFENLVFEGGGNKGMAYVGALQVFFSVFMLLCSFVLTYCGHRFLHYRAFTRNFSWNFCFDQITYLSFRDCVYPDIILSLCCLTATFFLQIKIQLLIVRLNSFANCKLAL